MPSRMLTGMSLFLCVTVVLLAGARSCFAARCYPAATTLRVTPTSLSFTALKVGSTSAPQTVTLTAVNSTGCGAVAISQIAIGGTNPADFFYTTTCGANLPVPQSCTIQVKFTPTAIGARKATLSITDNAPGSPQSVSLTGTGQ